MEVEQRFDFSLITESPGHRASVEQLGRLYQRYRFARDRAVGKDVLEVACGTGIGLRYLAQSARNVTAGDIDQQNLKSVHMYLGPESGIEVRFLDAQNLDLCDESVDLAILFEALYYLEHPQKFIGEAARVLRPGGELLLCTVNKNWVDFHPSPYTFKYFSVPELHHLLRGDFSTVEFYGGFPADNSRPLEKAISMLKRAAVSLDLIPGTLKSRAYLKRIFMGKLVSLPEQIYDGMTEYTAPVPITADKENSLHKIIYAVARK